MTITATAAEGPSVKTSIMLMETVAGDADDQDGMLSGSNALRLMGKAALAAASRHTNGKAVMTRIDDVRLYRPVPVGNLLDLTARVIHMNADVMTILVDGMTQPPTGGRRTLAFSGYFQMTTVA